MNPPNNYTDYNHLYQGLVNNENLAWSHVHSMTKEIVLKWSSKTMLELLWIVEEDKIPDNKEIFFFNIRDKFKSMFLNNKEASSSFEKFHNIIIEIAGHKLKDGFPPFFDKFKINDNKAWLRIKLDFENKLIYWFYQRGNSVEKAKELNDKTNSEIIEYIYKKNREVYLDTNNSKGLKSFFFGFANNILSNSRKNNRTFYYDDFDFVFGTITDTDNPIVSEEINEYNKKLVADLFRKADIDDESKKILFMHYYEGMSYDEIAKKLGKITNTCIVRANRARKNLQRVYESSKSNKDYIV